MLLVLSVAFVPVLLSVWQTLDCDRASNICRSSQRFLGIAISTSEFSASSMRGTRLVDSPSRDRGLVRHHWDIVVETAEGDHRVAVDASSEQDEELLVAWAAVRTGQLILRIRRLGLPSSDDTPTP